MADYPLFQNALKDSTPFGGTMADTSTPTPQGTQPQVQPPLPQTPQANEMPGQSGDRVRLDKIQQDRALLHEQMNYVATHRSTFKNPWHYAFELAISGKTETPSAAYERLTMLNRMLTVDAGLAQEERLLNQPSPTQLAINDQAAGRERRAADMNFLDRFYKSRGLPNPVSQEIQMQYIEKGYSLNEASANQGEDDILKAIQAGVNIGQDAPEAVPLIPEGTARKAGEAGAKESALARQRKATEDAKKKSDEERFPVGGLFKSPGELLTHMHTDYRDELNTEGNYHWEKYEVPDPIFPNRTQTKERKAWNADDKKQARAAVAAKYQGIYEPYFPNFVEKGFTDAPQLPPQEDVDVQKIRKSLREKAKEQ